MIGTQFTITNRGGESFILNNHSNPDRIVALQAYPTFDVDIKNNEVSREGQHGVWDFYSYYGRRSITFRGVIVGSTEAEVEAARDDMVKILALPVQPGTSEDGYVTVKWADANGSSWQIEAKLQNSINFNRNLKETYRLDFIFSLKAADPFIVSQNLITVVGTRGYVSAGAGFPIELPAVIGESQVGVVNINNTGAVYAHTVIRIYGESAGDITNPVIENLTTGQRFELATVISGEDNWIEIDSKEGTAVDQDGTDVSGTIVGSSNFITLKPGENQLLYSSDEDPQIVVYLPTAPFSTSFRLTKI